MAMKLDSYLQLFLSSPAEAAMRKYQFDIRVNNVSRLCHAKPIVTVSGRFLGPTVYTREGDRVLVNTWNVYQAKFLYAWEWWNLDVEILVNQANKLGLPPPTTDSGSTLPVFFDTLRQAILHYKGIPNTVLPSMPKLPAPNNTNVALRYNNCIRSLNSPQFQAKVPLKVNRHLFYTVGLGANLCSSCQNGTQLTASVTGLDLLSRDLCGLRQSVHSKLA
ncbi:hypothetical protein Gotur_003248 [Gossypium turneri]